MPAQYLIRKWISVLVTTSLLVSQSFAYAAPLPGAHSSNPSASEKLLFSEDLGKIEESGTGSNGKTVLYIQDAHDSLEAQENIARMITALVENDTVKTVYEEGYEGPVPSDDFFGFIKKPVLKEKTAYFFMNKLRLGGAEYAHINRKKDFKLVGADNRKLHKENIGWYAKAAREQPEVESDLRILSTEMDALAARDFPKEVSQWLKLKDRLSRDEIDAADYLKRTEALDPARGEHYPHLRQFIFMREHPEGPGLESAIRNFDIPQFFQEIDRWEDAFAFKSLKSETARKIFHYQKELILLRRLNEIKMTASEYQALSSRLTEIHTQKMADFIAHTAGKTVVLSQAWERKILSAKQFYETAHGRDSAIEKQLEAFLKNPSEKTCVLVFGGFHKDRIREALRRNGFSWKMIAPRVTRKDVLHQGYYKQLMTAGFYPFEAAFIPATASRPEPIFARSEARMEIEKISGLIAQFPEESLSLLERRLGDGRLKTFPAGTAKTQIFSRTADGTKRSEVRAHSFRIPARLPEELAKLNAEFPAGVVDKVLGWLHELGDKNLTLAELKSAFPEIEGAASRRIAFTGAPYAGKTTLMDALGKGSEDFIHLPEIIPAFREAGISLADIDGQLAVYTLKYLIERAAADLYPGKIVLADRGTLDGAAYWPLGWENFMQEIGGHEAELQRYRAVLQMETVASAGHAEAEYRDRVENAEQARELQESFERIWRPHPRYYFFSHTSWDLKSKQVLETLDFLKGQIQKGAAAPKVFDFSFQGQHYRYPNIAAYDFSEETLMSFFNRDPGHEPHLPLVLDLHFKAPCGLRCIFCYTEAGIVDERHAIDEKQFGTMQPEDIKAAIRQYAELGGHTMILLSIGEPLTNTKLFIEYANLAKSLGVRVVTFTNMLLITEEVARELRAAEVNLLLKLNHLDPKINNQLGGRDNAYKYVPYKGQQVPQQLVNVLEAYKDRPDLLALSSDITKINQDNILAISRWAYESLGVAHFRKHLYSFGFAQANREQLIMSDEAARKFDETLYAFDRQYGYQYPVPAHFADQYSFDMRRFLNNNMNTSGFPLRTFSHYISGIYHSSNVVIPRFGFKKGVKLAVRDLLSGRVDLEEFYLKIFTHIRFFRALKLRMQDLEDSYQRDKNSGQDAVQTNETRQKRWEEAYQVTREVKKYFAQYGKDLAVPDRQFLERTLERATEFARENPLSYIPDQPGAYVMAGAMLRTAFPAGEKFQFFSLHRQNAFYADPYQVTYSVTPPAHIQEIHGHFGTNEITVSLGDHMAFEIYRFSQGKVASLEEQAVPKFSAGYFLANTPHAILNTDPAQFNPNVTVKYKAQVTDRWNIKEGPSEDRYTHEGQVLAPHIEKEPGVTVYSYDKGALIHRIIELAPGAVWKLPLKKGEEKGVFLAQGQVQTRGPGKSPAAVKAESGDILYWIQDDAEVPLEVQNLSSEPAIFVAVDLKTPIDQKWQTAKARTYRALLADMDGVLTEPGSREVSGAAVDAVIQKLEAGLPVLLISGRNETPVGSGYRKQAATVEDVSQVFRERLKQDHHEELLGRLFFSSENGAAIFNGYDRDDPRREDHPVGVPVGWFSPAKQEKILDKLKAQDDLVDEHVVVTNKNHGFSLKDTFGTRVPRIAEALARELESLHLQDKMEIFVDAAAGEIHVYPKNVNKILGLNFLQREFNLKDADIAAFGDKGDIREPDHGILSRPGGFSTDTLDSESPAVPLRSLSGFLPGAQSFLWALNQLHFAPALPVDTQRHDPARSEVRGGAAATAMTPGKAALFVKADELAELSHEQAEELFTETVSLRSEIRLVVYGEDRRLSASSDRAIQALLKLPYVFLGRGSRAEVFKKYQSAQGGANLYLFQDGHGKNPQAEWKPVTAGKMEFYKLRRQMGEVAKGQIAAGFEFLKNGAQMQGVFKDSEGYWAAAPEFAAELARSRLRDLVVAYAA